MEALEVYKQTAENERLGFPVPLADVAAKTSPTRSGGPRTTDFLLFWVAALAEGRRIQ